jgi:PKD repeat protein
VTFVVRTLESLSIAVCALYIRAPFQNCLRLRLLKIYLGLLAIGFATGSNAQVNVKYFNTNDTHCGTDAYTEDYFQAHPEERIRFFETQNKLFERAQHRSARGELSFVIPVVVHVMHDNGIGDISDEQVQDAIDLLNEDYRRTNPDRTATREEFKPYAVAAPFEFRLARLDPNNNPTNGIHRVNDPSKTYNQRNGVKTGSGAPWDPRSYFNIWIVNSIQTSSGGTVLGYAQFPGSGSWSTYGLVMRHDQFGRIGTSNADGRTLTHEMGHCLGLYHTFQSGCGSRCDNSGDDICDTPPSQTATWSCNHNQNTCSTDENSDKINVVLDNNGDTLRIDTISLDQDYPDQVENYMSYDACQNMFTRGQVNVMIENTQFHSRLISMTSEDNLDETGVSDLYRAEFTANRNMVCTGGEVVYTDDSEYGVENWFWTLPGATPENPIGEEATVTYNTPGIYQARLAVSNSKTTKIKTKESFIMVNPADGYYYPDFASDFEDGVFPSGRWLGQDVDEAGASWQLNDQVGASGNNSLMVDNFNGIGGEIDYLFSSTYDLSVFESAELSFKYAFAKKLASNGDRVIVSYSNDCGETWTGFWNLNTTTLPTAPEDTTSEFVPTASEWREMTSALPIAALTENAQVRFTFISGGGNNFYLDAVNITGVWKDKPTLNSPAIGEEMDAFDVTIDWKSLIDVDSYEYEVSDQSDFSNIVFTGSKNYLGVDPNDSDTEFELTGLERGKLYFWRVRAVKSGTPTDWSDSWFFRVSQTVSREDYLSENAELKLFPNPNQGLLNVRLLGFESDYQMEVRDLSGRLVKDLGKRNEAELQIDLNDVQNGVYLLSVQNEDFKTVKRFVLHR